MRNLCLSAVLFVALSASPAVAETQTCETITKEQISALFDRWNASLATGKAEEVTKNYADDAVLLPTMSNKVRTSPAEITDYFVHFLQKKPNGTINSRTIRIGCNDASDVGTYTFSLTDKDGNKQDAAARYSFIYVFKDGKWLISHHHSSAMPEKTAAPSH